MTPMIDVVFLLIIFFMVGTQFSDSEREIDLSLPGAGQLNAMMSAPERRKVSVTSDGSVTLDGRSVDLATLTNELQRMRQSYPGLGVVVRADGSVEHQIVTAVYGAIDRAGVEDMSIAVRYQAASPSPNFR